MDVQSIQLIYTLGMFMLVLGYWNIDVAMDYFRMKPRQWKDFVVHEAAALVCVGTGALVLAQDSTRVALGMSSVTILGLAALSITILLALLVILVLLFLFLYGVVTVKEGRFLTVKELKERWSK